MESIGKLIMAAAGLLFLAGGIIYLFGRLGGGFLHGDVVIRRENTTFVFPLATMIVVSVVLTILLNIFFRGR